MVGATLIGGSVALLVAIALSPQTAPSVAVLAVADARAAFERADFAFQSGDPTDGGEARILTPLDDSPIVSIIGTESVKRIGVIGSPNADTVAAFTIAVELVFAPDPVPAATWFNERMGELRMDSSRNLEAAYSNGGRRITLHWLASTRALALSLDP